MDKVLQHSLQKGLTRYLSPEQLKRLASARIGIAGAGGLGSNCAMLLVRSGLHSFVLADFDKVEPSNLNRQFYWPEDLGKYKVEALAENLYELDPELELILHPKRIELENIAEIFSGCSVILEALDDANNKALFCNCILQNPNFSDTLLVAASGLAGFGGAPMQVKRLGPNFICVGDFINEAGPKPPLAPRVMQAAAMQADVVLEYLLGV